MVGGRDFNDSKFNRATQALRQVGSSFKPFVYTAAIDRGASPDDTILDSPITFQTPSGPYTPHNYDERYEGVITLRRALAQSRNIPALKLSDSLGIKTVIDYAHRFGITSTFRRICPLRWVRPKSPRSSKRPLTAYFPTMACALLPATSPR